MRQLGSMTSVAVLRRARVAPFGAGPQYSWPDPLVSVASISLDCRSSGGPNPHPVSENGPGPAFTAMHRLPCGELDTVSTHGLPCAVPRASTSGECDLGSGPPRLAQAASTTEAMPSRATLQAARRPSDRRQVITVKSVHDADGKAHAATCDCSADVRFVRWTAASASQECGTFGHSMIELVIGQ